MKIHKRFTAMLCVVICVAFVVNLAGCGLFGQKGPKTYNIGVALDGAQVYLGEVESYFNGQSTDEVIYSVVTAPDAETQIAAVKQLITQKAKALIVELKEIGDAAEMINLAKKAKIPMIFINTEPAAEDLSAWDKAYFVGTQENTRWASLGEIVRDFQDGGDINGDGMVRYIALAGTNSQNQVQQMDQVLQDAGVNVQQEALFTGDIAASELTELLKSKKIDLIIATSDAYLPTVKQGAASASKIVGEDLYVISAGDTGPSAVSMLQNKEISGTVQIDLKAQMAAAAELAKRCLDGETVETFNWVAFEKLPKIYKIGVSLTSYGDSYVESFADEMLQYSKTVATWDALYTIKLAFSDYDSAVQLQQIQEFIDTKVDVIVARPLESMETIKSMTSAARIPFICYQADGSPEQFADELVCFLGTDIHGAGRAQGEIVLSQPNHGDIDGDGVVRYVMIKGASGNIDAQMRAESAIKVLTDAGVQVECLMEESGDWGRESGRQIAASALSKFGKKIDVVFCSNDDTAIGAYQAIRAAGRTVNGNIYVLGIDATGEARSMVRRGTLTGTVAYNPGQAARTALDIAIDFINGIPVADIHYVEYDKITAT